LVRVKFGANFFQAKAFGKTNCVRSDAAPILRRKNVRRE
jgi:hypothetical protein